MEQEHHKSKHEPKADFQEHEVHSSNTGHHKKSKNTNRVIAIIVAVLAVILVGGLAWVYTGKLSPAKEKILTTLPLPAAIVDTKFVSAESVITRINLAKQLMEEQGMGEQVDAADTYKQLIEVKKVEAIGSNKNISVTNDEINEEYQNIITQYFDGNAEDFQKELDKTYKMSADEFKKEVIRQRVLQSNLSLWYSRQKDLNEAAYKTAQDLYDKINNGQNFDEIAKIYTQDEATKDFAGDSGMIPYDDLLAEFREELKDSKVGDTKLIASRYGLHVLKVLELNDSGENGAKQIHLQQIFVQQDGFEDWLTKEIEGVKVIQLLKFV